MGSLTAAWLTEIVLISYRAAKRGGEGTAQLPFPLPAHYAATFIVFGVLGLLPKQAGAFPAIVGWGFVAATFLNLYAPIPPGSPPGTGPKVAGVGQPTAPSLDQPPPMRPNIAF